jgi:23S rRNA pseudouridine2605 synthase
MNTEKKGERIAKVIAASGACSRRDAEKIIMEGRVKVSGKLINSPALNVTDEEITIDDILITKPAKARMFKYYKPVGLVTTHKDEHGRPTVFESLPTNMPRVISVGRLDLNSEGLLLLTTSGEVAREFELPSSNLERVYRVRVYGNVNMDELKQLKKGIEIDGIRYGSVDVTAEKIAVNSWLRVSIREGKNREVRKVLAHFGLEVSRLIRIRYGEYELGDLQPGEVEEIRQ